MLINLYSTYSQKLVRGAPDLIKQTKIEQKGLQPPEASIWCENWGVVGPVYSWGLKPRDKLTVHIEITQNGKSHNAHSSRSLCDSM